MYFRLFMDYVVPDCSSPQRDRTVKSVKSYWHTENSGPMFWILTAGHCLERCHLSDWFAAREGFFGGSTPGVLIDVCLKQSMDSRGVLSWAKVTFYKLWFLLSHCFFWSWQNLASGPAYIISIVFILCINMYYTLFFVSYMLYCVTKMYHKITYNWVRGMKPSTGHLWSCWNCNVFQHPFTRWWRCFEPTRRC